MLESPPQKDGLNQKSRTFYYAILLSALLLLFILGRPTKVQAESNLHEAWQEIVKIQPPAYKTLNQAIGRFIKIQQQSNNKNVTIYSLALLQKAADDKLSPKSKELLTAAAVRISPDYSFPETAFCKLMFKQHHYIKSLMSFFRALKKFQNNPLESLYASTFFWLALAFTPLALLFFLSLILSLKYYRAFCEMGNLKLSDRGGQIMLLISLVTALLIIVLPAPLLGLLILSVSLALLATRRDIIALLLLVASLIIVPLAYEKGMASLLALDSSFFKAARSSISGIDTQNHEAALNQPATNQSQLALQLFSQAEAARRRREFAKAAVFLKRIIANNVKIGAIYNNLANLYILQGNYKASEPLFIKAAELEKDSGIPYYNLSVTYIQDNFDLQKSSQALAKAFKRDPGLNKIHINSANSESELSTGTKLLFMNLPEDFYRQYADAQPGKKVYLPEFFRRTLFTGADKIIYFILIIFSLGGLTYWLRQTPANRKICSDCGRMFHPIQELKKKRCPVCSMNNIALDLHLKAWGNVANNHLRPSNIVRGLAWVLIPGYYPLLIGNTVVGTSLILATTLWIYNLFICQTTIMAPFPPSTAWLKVFLPLVIWSTNFAFLLIMHRWHHKIFKR